MNDAETHSGGCQCGKIRYAVTGEIPSVAHCHCTMCRRSTGGTVMTWATVPRARFAYTQGEPAVYRSSEHGRRQFCPTCGTHLVFLSDHAPESLDITLGSFDEPGRFPPDRHIWTESRLPWLTLDPQLPAHARWSTEGAED